VRKNRLFAVGKKYSDIDWSSLAVVLDAFEKRIDQWYLEPVRLLRAQPGQHGAFAAMSICCLLVDCLCQFDSGKVVSNRTLFRNYIRKRLPHYRRSINPPIVFPDVDTINAAYKTTSAGAIRTKQLGDIADVLYFVFRCGILHSAHAPLCGVISGLKTRRFSVRRKSLTKYSGIGIHGADCPSVVIDPWKLFDEIETAFRTYLAALRGATPSDTVRLHFNTKFEDSFGISITAAR
jgi:hypothetical protein